MALQSMLMQLTLSVTAFIVRFMSRGILALMASGLGYLLHRFWGKRRAIVVRNIALCFPLMPLRHQAALERAVFRSVSMGLLEALVAWQGRAETLLGDVEIYGDEYLQVAMESGKGVLLLSPHFSSLELLGAWVADRVGKKGAKSAGVYFPQKNRGFDEWVLARREKHYKSRMIKDSELREMIRFLKEAGVLVMYPDLDRGRKRSIFVDFFDIPAATMPVVPKMIRLTGAQVLPISLVRTNGRYRIDILPPMNDLLVGDDLLDTRSMNRVFERRIAEYPEQYHWVHRRFKTRPEKSDPSLYEG